MPDINYVKLLIEMDDGMLVTELENVPLPELRKNLALALKMQDRDTRHACAESVLEKKSIAGEVSPDSLMFRHDAHAAVMNTKAI